MSLAEAQGPSDRWLYSSPFDELVWRRAREEVSGMAELVAEVQPRVPTVEPLLADLFAAFYRADVRWRDESASEVVALHRPILERILACAPYRRLHPVVAGQLDDSLMVVDAFTRSFASSLNPELLEFLDAEAAYHERKAELAAEAQLIQALQQSRARARRQTTGERGPEQMSAAERRERLAELADELELLEHRHRTDNRLVVARADLPHLIADVDLPRQLARVERTWDDFRSALVTWGDDHALAERVPLEERLALFRRFAADERLRRATALLGRNRFLASVAHRSRTPAATPLAQVVEPSSDVARMLPSEAVWLSEPAAEIEFYRRVATAELLTRRSLPGSDPGRGPLVVLLDESGSMAGEPDIIAKAIALALLGIARNDGRAGALIEFSDAGALRTTLLEDGSLTPAAVAEVLSHFFGGGTDFDTPIAAGLRLVAERPGLELADLLIVTDGGARLHRDTVAALRAARTAGVRFFAVCVGTDDVAFRDVAERCWSDVDLLAEQERPGLLPDLVDAIHRGAGR